MFEHGFKRTYLKFGRKYTEDNRYRLEMETPDSKVEELIKYINNNNPTNYDYPVPDATVIPVTDGNSKYIQTARVSKKIDFDKIVAKQQA